MEVNFQPFETLVQLLCPFVLVYMELVIGTPPPFHTHSTIHYHQLLGISRLSKQFSKMPPLKWSYDQRTAGKKNLELIKSKTQYKEMYYKVEELFFYQVCDSQSTTKLWYILLCIYYVKVRVYSESLNAFIFTLCHLV